MKIAISGASGFIGTHLSAFLAVRGHQITPLGRNMFRKEEFPRLLNIISESDIVINLAGAPINRRWTSGYKKILKDSRIIPTSSLAEAINTASKQPQLFISASAVGYYPTIGCYDEYNTQPGSDFLAELCQEWEAEARKVSPEVRLAITRFGIVLAPDGGALRQLLQAAAMKLTTVIGSGNQPFTWVDLQDLLRAMVFIIDTPELNGIFNLVAPCQITHAEFSRELALHTHTLMTLKIPAYFFRLLYGEGAGFLTRGQCVSPTRLSESGFRFTSENISDFFKQEK